MEQVAGGWDSRACIDGDWLVREPLRADVRPRLLLETRLLPWLAPQLPLPIPLPEVVQEEPLRVRHRLLPGAAADQLSTGQGAELGRFLRVLHGVDVGRATALGAPSAEEAWQEHLRTLRRSREEVLPRLPPTSRGAAETLLERLSHPAPEPALVHGDVGPAHVLLRDGAVSGVIDWGDAHVGDPAIDLAWLLHGSGAGEAVAAAYGAGPATRRRALDWHRLGPWHEVLHGLDIGGPGFVDSGLAGVLARLA